MKMITAGIDIGHESVNVVLLEEKQILGQASFIIAGEVGAAARTAFETILDQQGMNPKQVDRLFATGVGREKVAFADSHPNRNALPGRRRPLVFPEGPDGHRPGGGRQSNPQV